MRRKDRPVQAQQDRALVRALVETYIADPQSKEGREALKEIHGMLPRGSVADMTVYYLVRNRDKSVDHLTEHVMGAGQ